MLRLAFLPLAFVSPLATSGAHFDLVAGGTGGCILTITCPDDAKLFCGGSTDPDALGAATATSTCDPSPVVTYHDIVVIPGCEANRFVSDTQRVWTATDSAGNTASCTQMIHVVKQVWNLDIHPRSCPNPIQVNGNGIIPVAILGTATQDVTQIDPTSIQVWAENCTGGPVSPVNFHYEDVAAPYAGNDICGCTTAGPDGYLDLWLRFDKQQFVQSLHLANHPKFSYVKLMITARTLGGCEIIGADCVRVQ